MCVQLVLFEFDSACFGAGSVPATRISIIVVDSQEPFALGRQAVRS